MNITIARFALSNIVDNRKDEKSAAFVAFLKRLEGDKSLELDTEKYCTTGLMLHNGPSYTPFYGVDAVQQQINTLLAANGRPVLDVPKILNPGLATMIAEAALPWLRIIVHLNSIAEGFELIDYSARLMRSVPGKDWSERFDDISEGDAQNIEDETLCISIVINPAPMTAEMLEEALMPRRARKEKKSTDIGASSENGQS